MPPLFLPIPRPLSHSQRPAWRGAFLPRHSSPRLLFSRCTAAVSSTRNSLNAGSSNSDSSSGSSSYQSRSSTSRYSRSASVEGAAMAPGEAGSSADVATASGKEGAPSHSPDDVRQKLQQTLAEDNKGGWDRLWQDGLTPWDLKGITPAVAHLLRDDADAAFALLPLLAGKHVLVPGCGTGYDVLEFAAKGAQLAVGLDISANALDSARKNAEGKPGSEAVRFELADFFAYSPEMPFDVIFDYTFFCALQPSLRDDWGRKTAELLAPPGVLLTLMFPIGDHAGGPPFAVSKAAYEAVLRPLGFISEDLPTVSHPARQGKEQLVKWQRSKASSL